MERLNNKIKDCVEDALANLEEQQNSLQAFKVSHGWFYGRLESNTLASSKPIGDEGILSSADVHLEQKKL